MISYRAISKINLCQRFHHKEEEEPEITKETKDTKETKKGEVNPAYIP